MQELTKDVIDTLEKRGYADQTTQIVSSLKEFRITPDFEAIYSVLEGLGNIKQGVKDAGPFAAYVCRRLSEIGNIPDSEGILLPYCTSFSYSAHPCCSSPNAFWAVPKIVSFGFAWFYDSD